MVLHCNLALSFSVCNQHFQDLFLIDLLYPGFRFVYLYSLKTSTAFIEKEKNSFVTELDWNYSFGWLHEEY